MCSTFTPRAPLEALLVALLALESPQSTNLPAGRTTRAWRLVATQLLLSATPSTAATWSRASQPQERLQVRKNPRPLHQRSQVDFLTWSRPTAPRRANPARRVKALLTASRTRSSG